MLCTISQQLSDMPASLENRLGIAPNEGAEMQIWSVGWKSGTWAPLCAESTLRGPFTSSTSVYGVHTVLLRRSLIGYPVMPGKWGSAVIAEPRRVYILALHSRIMMRRNT